MIEEWLHPLKERITRTERVRNLEMENDLLGKANAALQAEVEQARTVLQEHEKLFAELHAAVADAESRERVLRNLIEDAIRQFDKVQNNLLTWKMRISEKK